MSLSRSYEENEVGGEIRRIYSEVRSAFDLPFVPTIFKTAAGMPDYLKLMWRDLGPVASSKEFYRASESLDEFIRSQAIGCGLHFSDQERVLAEQNVSTADMPVLSGVVGIFARALPRMALFTRLIQRGYSGGQKGRVTPGRQAPALSRMISLHVPNERDASLRVWLIYSDIRRTMGTKQVMSLFRALSPFPGYLASAWLDSKNIMQDKSFLRSRDAIAQRAAALTVGMPVRDHRALGKAIPPAKWWEIEQTMDNFARLLPGLALLSIVWRRSFSNVSQSRAA